jgi:hypothetical protein
VHASRTDRQQGSCQDARVVESIEYDWHASVTAVRDLAEHLRLHDAMLVAPTTFVANTIGEDRAELELQGQVIGAVINAVLFLGSGSRADQEIRHGLIWGQYLRAFGARFWGVEEGVARRAVAGFVGRHLVG